MVSYQIGRTTKDDIVIIFGTPDQLTAVFTPESALELAHFLTTHANNILMDQRAAAGVQG